MLVSRVYPGPVRRYKSDADKHERNGGEQMDKAKIGERLTKLRGDRSLSEVARALGMSVSSLSRYESGERMPSDVRKTLFAQFYGVTVQELFYAQ